VKTNHESQRPTDRRIIRVECNMEEFPYFRLSKRDAKSRREIRYFRQTRDPRGELLLQRWIVRASGELGLPGPFDQDVYVALEQIIDEHVSAPRPGATPPTAGAATFEDGIPFTKYRIAEIMGKGHSGIIYRKLTEAIQRMVATSITSEHALYHRGKKHHLSGTFSLFDEVAFYSRRTGITYHGSGRALDRDLEYNLLFPSRWYLQSRRHFYTKPLDIALYRSLRLPTAKKLYRWLDKRRYPRRRVLVISLAELTQALPLAPGYASFLKKVLDKAHAELLAHGYLERATYTRTAGGHDWKVTYLLAPARSTRRLRDPLARQLHHRGVAASVATRLARERPDVVARQVEVFDWRRSRGLLARTANPPAYLRKAIEEDYPPPPGFVSEDEKRALKQASEKQIARRRRELAKQETDRREQRELVEEIKATRLTPAQLRRLEAEAEQALGPFLRRKLQAERETGHLEPTTRLALEDQLHRLIEQRFLEA